MLLQTTVDNIPDGYNVFAELHSDVIWATSKPVTKDNIGGAYLTKTNDYMSLTINFDSVNYIESLANNMYIYLFDVLNYYGFKYPFRIWNFVPYINSGEGDNEVYKKFCTGRLNAFNELQLPSSEFPSASCVGTKNGRGSITIFASKVKPTHVQNKNQINAFDYPRKYGPSSPSFARATSLCIDEHDYFFISGTSSILGHATIGKDLDTQLNVTEDNIKHLLKSEHNKSKPKFLTAYVRNKSDYPIVANWLDRTFPNVKNVIVAADICRSQLLVEVECFCD